MSITMKSEKTIAQLVELAQLVERMVAMITFFKAWVRIPLPTIDFFLFSEKRGVYHPNVFSLPPP